MNSEPELGQLLFSNSTWEEYEIPDYVENGIALIGNYISRGDISRDPTSNSGCELFSNDVFTIRPYCWCNGERKGHEDECPPNFQVKSPNPLIIRWYKHASRSASMNRKVSYEEWWAIMRSCMDSILKNYASKG